MPIPCDILPPVVVAATFLDLLGDADRVCPSLFRPPPARSLRWLPWA